MMTPAEEDALIEWCYVEIEGLRDISPERIRLAIRAAVAAERERAATRCDKIGQEYSSEIAVKCAAAIRRGE